VWKRSRPGSQTFAAERLFRVERGLYIREPKNGRTFQARCRIDGKWRTVGTDTTDFNAAEAFARRWYRQLHAGTDGHETIAQAADAFLKSIRDDDKRAYHQMKWEAVREFWSPGFDRPSALVTEVDSLKLVEFVQWRQARTTLGRSNNASITANTVHKDLVLSLINI
jgi:hypothetical protein